MPNAPVRLFEKTLKLPGYPPGPDERVPLFFQDGHIRIYPYPLRDHITFKKQTLQVRALGLENEHVRVLVTPCFGGHVWSFYDKRRKREVFYTPDLVKPGLIRLPGAWMPLGLEFNFPNGHTPMSMSPVAASARKLPDGAAGIVVGDVDLMTRMRWQVEVSLRPGVAAMDVSVRLSNPMPRRQRWYFWANAGVEVSEGWQFLCPARYGREAWTGGQFDFPVHRGRDVTRYTNYDGGGEVFVAGVAEDFFGCYDHDSGEGIVHVADWRAMRGKKFFTWGSGPEGKVWGRMFCDKPVRHYAEIQCGPLETQADREWFPPYGERSWSDRWYPVAGTGPFFFATAQLALGVRGAGAKRKLTLFPCEDLGPATLELRLGKAVRRTRLTLRAGRRAEAACGGEGSFRARVRDAQGRVLVDVSYPYRPRMEAGTLERLRKQRLQVARLEKPGSPRERVEQADKWLIDGEVRRGRKRLEEALKEDPDHPRARLLRGELFLSQGLWGRAEVDLKAAEASAERGVSSEARFLRGVLARYRGNLMEAGDAFLKASVLEIHESQTWARAEQALAEVELAQGAALRAKGRLGRLCENPAHVTAQRMTLLALSRRLLGDCYGALSTVESVLRDDPLYLPARWERWAAAHYGRLEPFKVQLEEIHKLHESGAHPSADRAMEVAWWYANLGQYALAVTVLGASQFEDPRPSYLAAYLDARGGLAPTSWAEKHLDRAAKLRAEYAFPFRLEEEALFDWVTRQRPNDAQAWCLRGTLQGSFFRFDEAAGNFRKAVKLDPRDALAWRNLGICLWQLGRPPHVSTECFEQAHALRPDDPDIACELLSQYERMGRTEKRVALLEGASRGLRANHRFRKRALGILAEAGRFHEAVQLVEKQPFVRWEGEVSPHGVYAFGCLELCREALAGRRHAEAVRWAERAGRYPATTFTVRPSKPVDCIWRYWKAVALEASGKRKQAEAEYRKAADEGDWSVWYWISTEAPLWRAMARRRLGREREARADLKKVLKLSTRKELFYGGSTAFADYISALANLALGDREAAIKGLETVLKEGGLRFRARPWIAELRKAKGAKRFLWPHERMGQDTQQ